MKLDVFASLPHYRDHLRAVWEACGADGTWWSTFGDDDTEQMPGRGWPHPSRPVLVASFADAQKVAGRPIIHLEHGAGQRYAGDPDGAYHPSYAGGIGMPDSVVLFLTPGVAGARAWRDAYPHVPAEAIGCPKLDRWTRAGTALASARRLRAGRPTVALTFHWDCTLVPETRTALWHYDDQLPQIVAGLRSAGFNVIGHEHPRWQGKLLARWHELGVPTTPDPEAVFASAHVLIADNTSLMYEAAACGMQVVALNAPWYRKDIEHGLRFWSAVPGIQVDRPADVVGATCAALDGRYDALRVVACSAAYRYLDGKAAERAAAAIEVVAATC